MLPHQRAYKSHAYRWVALAIMLAASGALVYGIISWRGGSDFGVYFALFGFAAVFFFSGAHVLPTAKNNRRAVERAWDEAQAAMANVLPEDFPRGPLRASHRARPHDPHSARGPRAEQGGSPGSRGEGGLSALTADVQVEQEEHDEVVVIKPLFLVSDYHCRKQRRTLYRLHRVLPFFARGTVSVQNIKLFAH